MILFIQGKNAIYLDGQASSSAIINSNNPNRAKNYQSRSPPTDIPSRWKDYQPTLQPISPSIVLSSYQPIDPPSMLLTLCTISLFLILYWKCGTKVKNHYDTYFSVMRAGLKRSDEATFMGDNVS